MLNYIVRRVLQAIPIFFGITLLTFALAQSVPGGPIDAFTSPRQTPAVRRALERLYGLNQPAPQRYVKWVTALVRGEWGNSFLDQRPVREKIFERAPATLELTGTALLITLVIGLPLGILSATKQYSFFDNATNVIAYVGYAFPTFFLGILLLFAFSFKTGWFPAFGRYDFGREGDTLNLLKHLVLPAVTLAAVQVAGWSRYMRSQMLEVIRQDYIRTARAKGLPMRSVIYKHAVRNALIPIVTLFGLSVPALMAGAAVVESIFSWPGLGQMAVQAVFTRDYPLIMGFTVVAGVTTIIGNLMADVMYAAVDPRIRY